MVKRQTIGTETPYPLSRRRARKLAALYRGSRRGQWYRDFLDGVLVGFVARNNRLHRVPGYGGEIRVFPLRVESLTPEGLEEVIKCLRERAAEEQPPLVTRITEFGVLRE